MLLLQTLICDPLFFSYYYSGHICTFYLFIPSQLMQIFYLALFLQTSPFHFCCRNPWSFRASLSANCFVCRAPFSFSLSRPDPSTLKAQGWYYTPLYIHCISYSLFFLLCPFCRWVSNWFYFWDLIASFGQILITDSSGAGTSCVYKRSLGMLSKQQNIQIEIKLNIWETQRRKGK